MVEPILELIDRVSPEIKVSVREVSHMSDMNQKIIKEFRANGGKVGGFFENMDLLLLHTIGSKSGQPRLNPTAYIQDGERLVIAASKGGADSHPDWYYNLAANPDVTVEVEDQKYTALAKIAAEPERTELFNKLKGTYPGFGDYEIKTRRVIPVITITKN